MRYFNKTIIAAVLMGVCALASAQKYKGVVDKTIAVVGNEFITISGLEDEVQIQRAQGAMMGQNERCEVLENFMASKLFLMQARVDSLNVNKDVVSAELTQRLDQVRTAMGGDEGVEEYFKKPIYKLRQEWQTQLEENSLTQQEQQEIAKKIPDVTPYDVKKYLDSTDVEDLPVIPIKYKMSRYASIRTGRPLQLRSRNASFQSASASSMVKSSPPWPASIPRILAAQEREENSEWRPSRFSGRCSRMRQCP